MQVVSLKAYFHQSVTEESVWPRTGRVAPSLGSGLCAVKGAI
jgi:hypothetical protein